MRVLDFMGFNNVPGGSAGAAGTSIPGTRLNVFSLIYNGAVLNHLAQVVERTDPWWSTTMTVPGSNFIARALTCETYVKLANVAPDVVSTDTGITIGIRMRHGAAGASSDWKTTARQLSLVHATGNATTPLITSADWDTTVDGTIHYFEAVYNRATQSVKLYKNNGFFKEINVAAQVAASGRVIGFSFGINGSALTGSGPELSVKDIYLAEFDPAVDVIQRLGPQQVVPMPISQVQATWPVVGGSTQVASLNDFQANMKVPAAAPTLVTVTDNDANGLLSFDTTALSAVARVNALQYSVDALGTPSTTNLQGELMNGAAVEDTKVQSFTTAYDYTKDSLLSNFGRKLILKNFPTAAPGNKAAVDAYKLRLKAVAP